MIESEERQAADRIDGVPLPAERIAVSGHSAAVRQFCQTYASGRMHHAWLISGLRGIGKATLAFRFSAHMLANPDPSEAPEDLAQLPAEHPVNRQIASGSHPNLLHLTRPWDEKTKRFKTQLPAEEIRRTQQFYGMTAGAGGWRITLVDAADDMNASAANALLKILEEPPARSVFFVIAHAPGSLLPTIRSRCRALPLQPLGIAEVSKILAADGHNVSQEEAVSRLAGGSVRRALSLQAADGLDHFQTFENVVSGDAADGVKDWAAIHKLADALARRGQEQSFDLFYDLVLGWIAGKVRQREPEPAPAELAGWAEVWEKANQSFGVASAFNLDKKQVVLSLFQMIFDRNR